MSLSQPHWLGVPPSQSVSQNLSISSWDLQLTTNETASVKGNWGPPFNATNSWPASRNCTVITEPFGPGPASPYG